MTELPCPACHGEMAVDWDGSWARCGCSAEIHMGGGWLWPSFEVPLKPLTPESVEAPPPRDWRFEETVRLDRGGVFRTWIGHSVVVALDRSALTLRRRPGRLRRGDAIDLRVPTAMVQLFVPVCFDLFFQGLHRPASSRAAAPVRVTNARIATRRFGVFAVARERVLDDDDDLPTWLRGRVLPVSVESAWERARTVAAHANAALLRFAGGYR